MGVSQHPQVTRQDGPYPVQMPKARQVEFRQVNRGSECDLRMPGNFSILAGVKTRNGRETICDSVGQGVRHLLGYGGDPIGEFFEATKIPASNLPLIKRMEDIQLHWRSLEALRDVQCTNEGSLCSGNISLRNHER